MDHDGVFPPVPGGGPQPGPDPGGPKEKQKKKDPSVRRLLVFGAVTLLVCVLVSAATGALSSFLVLRFVPLLSPASTQEENTFVPELAEPFTQTQPVPEETSAVPAQAETAAPAPETLAPAVPAETAPPAKTKGEIYAEAVNSIVSVRCESLRTVQNVFGFGMTQTVTSSGSGFFWTADGYAVTNYHVVENARSVSVTLYDGSVFPASVAGSDPSNDIAVLKVDGSFRPAEVGDSASLSVGDDVLVIGNALGELSYTFTDGVVSYLSRLVTTDSGASVRMFQTNAAINEGNSGGPVYNMDGKVVGIASAKYASDSIEGLGFCIPIDDVKGKIADLIRVGYVTGRPELGVSVQSVSAAVAARYGIPQGCYVVAVGAGTAADAAGIRSGDVITAVDGYAVTSCAELSAVLEIKAAGEQTTLTVSRQGYSYEFSLLPDEKKPAPARTDYSNVYDV